MQRELLPEYHAAPNAAILSGVTVTRLVTNGERRVVAAEVRTAEGSSKLARARVFVAACGGLETSRLLLLSGSETFPNGIGNAYDRVGRGFNEHPGVNFYGKIRHNRHTIIPRHKIGRTHQVYDDFRSEGLGSVLPVFIQSFAFPNHLMQPRWSDGTRSLGAVLGRVLRPTLYIGATIEMFPNPANRLTLDESRVDRFGQPLAHLHLSFSDEDRRTLDRTRSMIRSIFDQLGPDALREGELTWSRHHIGTCRMGRNPKTSVADPRLRVHDCANLYLCGSETFVTGAAVPPVLTIRALAHRLADHLVDRLHHI